MFDIQIIDTEFQAELQKLVGRVSNPSHLMKVIAHSLESQTQDAFKKQGPGWKALSERTRAARAKRGTWPGQILNESGGRGLLGSVMSDSGSDWAAVGAGSGKSAKYAAIHQLGGNAGRGLKTKIEARPYMPLRANGTNLELTPQASDSILRLARDFVDGKDI